MQFFVDNSIYVALIVAALILLGLLAYLVRIDARLRRLERDDLSAGR